MVSLFTRIMGNVPGYSQCFAVALSWFFHGTSAQPSGTFMVSSRSLLIILVALWVVYGTILERHHRVGGVFVARMSRIKAPWCFHGTTVELHHRSHGVA